MKTLALLVFLVCACALEADEANPYLLTRLRPLLLIVPRERPDHSKFLIEVFSRGGTNTNWVKFEKEDTLLTVHDLKAVPDGPAILVVRSIYADGETTEAVAYDIDIRRKRPAPPMIKSVELTEDEAKAKTFDDLMFIRRRERAAKHPAPAPAGAIITVAHPTTPPPIPDATNRPYSSQLRRNE